MRGLKDKVAVIAGGGSGIGAATARRLAEEGAQLVVGDLSADAARAVSSSIAAAARSSTRPPSRPASASRPASPVA